MALPLPMSGARAALSRAGEALRVGDLDEMSWALRAYFSHRYLRPGAEMRGIDAEVCMLAATAAALRGDTDELEAIAVVVGQGGHSSVLAARQWVDLLVAAMTGDSPRVFDALRSMKTPAIAGVGASVMLLAAERGLGRLRAGDIERLEAGMREVELSPVMRARVALVAAAVARRRGDAGWRRRLDDVGEELPVAYRLLAALLRDDLAAARRLHAQLPPADAAAVAGFAAELAAATSSAAVEWVLSAFAASLTDGQRERLTAALVMSRAREGRAEQAAADMRHFVGDTSLSRAMAPVQAYVALVAGRADRAAEILAAQEQLAPGEQALRLLALAAAGSAPQLEEALAQARDLPPELGRRIAGPLLAALARAGQAPALLPAWLLERPGDPAGLYAWAIVRYLQGALGDAIAAFGDAIAADPALASLTELPDLARLAAARDALAAGDRKRASALAGQVAGERLRRDAERLQALALIAEHAAVRGRTIDDASFPQLLAELSSQATGAAERRLLQLLADDAARLQARGLLQAGKPREAAQVLAGDAGPGDAEVAFLRAVAALMQGASVESVQEALRRAVAHDGSHAGAAILLAELQSLEAGSSGQIAALERLRDSAAPSPLVEEALAAAYGGARRGLDAKRVGFAELRRLGSEVPDLLAAQISEALALEAPPADHRARSGTLQRARPGGLLLPEEIANRIPMLVDRAERRAAGDPRLRAAVDEDVRALKRALVADDLAGAHQIEQRLLVALGGAP